MVLNAVIRILGQAQSAQRMLDGLTNQLEGLQRVGDRVSSVGQSMSLGITAPILAAGTGIIHTAASFEGAMNQVRAVSGATGESFEQLRDQAKDLGATTQFSASQAAEAQAFLAMAGFETNEILSALPDTLNLAAAGSLDLGQAADIASNILSGMNLEVDQLSRVNNVLAETARSANTNVGMMGESFKYVAPVAAATGQDLELMAAAIGILGDAGIQGSQGGTVLRASIMRLVNPPREAAAELANLGVEVLDATGQMRSFDVILQDLADSGASIEQIGEIFGTEAASGIAALMSRSEDLTAFSEDLRNVGNTAEEMANIQMEGFLGQLKALQSATEGLAITIADTGLLDWAVSAVEGLTNLIQRVNELNPNILKAMVIVAGIAAVVGPTLIIIGQLITAISAISGVAAAFSGLFAMGGALAALGPPLSMFAATLGSLLSTIILFAGALAVIPLAFFKVGAAVAGVDVTWREFFTMIGLSIQEGIASVSQLPSAIGGAFSALVNIARLKFTEMRLAIFTKLGEIAMNALEKATEIVNNVSTGIANGIGTVTDAVNRIRNAIIETITGIASRMFEAGSNIVSRLAEGITSGIGAVTGAMQSVAAAAAGFWPGSPVKYGPLTAFNNPQSSPTSRLMDMAAQGLQANPLNTALNDSLSPGTGSRNIGGGSISINAPITIQGNASPDVVQQLRDAHQEFLENMEQWLSDKQRVGYVG